MHGIAHENLSPSRLFTAAINATDEELLAWPRENLQHLQWDCTGTLEILCRRVETEFSEKATRIAYARKKASPTRRAG